MPEGLLERSSRRRLEFPSHPSASLRAFLMQEDLSTLKTDRAKPGVEGLKGYCG
jgi:hypothetical protein